MLEPRRKLLVCHSTRLSRCAALCFGFTLILLSAEGYAQLSPFNVGNQTQLFVDRVLVREATGVAFTLHPARKHPANP